jgi:hypothetical protein
MPIPTPRPDEEESDFVSRCVSAISGEYDDNDQAVAICMSTYRDKDKAVNEELLKAIRDRSEKKTEFNYGILTADRFVKSVLECVGSDICYRYAATKANSFDDILKKATKQLVYSNADMVLEDVYGTNFKRVDKDGDELELPKNTLMVFRHVLTTDRKDRDGDIMRTNGAIVDPKMLLLWQHIPTLPIGKHLGIAEHTDKLLSTYTAIIDMNELCHDAAVMVDNKMARFSHGFRALQFSKLKAEEKEMEVLDDLYGFDVSKYEILEKSMVSIPSNIDAEVEEVMMSLVSGGKLTSHIMKSYGDQIKEHRPKRVPVSLDLKVTVNGKAISDGEEKRDSKKSGCGCDGEGEGKGKAGASKEADGGAGTEQKSGEPESQKMTVYAGMVKGSWEYIEYKLREKARDRLASSGILIDTENYRSWVSLIATYSDHAIIVHEKWSNSGDSYEYYRSGWELRDDEPEFTGEFREVKIEVETKIIDKMLSVLKIKAGRSLSKENMKVIQDVRDDVEYLKEHEDLSRGGMALCDKCLKNIDDLMNKAEDMDDDKGEPKTITVKEAMSIFLAEATIEQRKTMSDTLAALKIIDDRTENTRKYKKLVGTN